MAWMLCSVFGGLTLLGWLVSHEWVYLITGLLAMIAIPFVSREFLRAVERSAPIIVQADGIQTYDGFGVKAFVRWSDVKRTRKMILWPGFKWLLLDDGRGYMKLAGVPVFLKDKPAFYREVVKAVGEDHVVTVALRDNGFCA